MTDSFIWTPETKSNQSSEPDLFWGKYVGGEAGIRTLGRAFRPYNGLANRRLQPLGHLTVDPLDCSAQSSILAALIIIAFPSRVHARTLLRSAIISPFGEFLCPVKIRRTDAIPPARPY